MATVRPCIKFKTFHHYKQYFYWGTFEHFALLKNHNMANSSKVLRTMAISERYVIERHLLDNRYIKIMLHFICHRFNMVFHMREKFITFLFNHTYISTECVTISFYLYICCGLTANQISHSLKPLALLSGYVLHNRRFCGLY